MNTAVHCPLARTLDALCISRRELARGAQISLAAAQRLAATGSLPRRSARAAGQRVLAFLKAQGATPPQLGSLLLPPPRQAAEKNAPAGSRPAEALPTPIQPDQSKEEPMLLQAASLSHQAKQHFGLPRSPFVDDVQSREDVFHCAGTRYAIEALADCARNSGFMALIGESGAGKSTLIEELEDRLRDTDVLIIKPYVLAMEINDSKGKTLKASHIAEAIVSALDPNAKLRSSPQARFAQLHQLLKDSRRTGRRHLLVIEEAHCLPHPTLKHLKRFTELKDGLQRLIGVALIAQPELARTLSGMNAEIREVAQRCDVVTLEPLDADLEDYLRHKFARFKLKYEDVFAPDAADAIRARLIQHDRNTRAVRSVCFPLAVHNLVCRAMNVAASVQYPRVDAQAVSGC